MESQTPSNALEQSSQVSESQQESFGKHPFDSGGMGDAGGGGAPLVPPPLNLGGSDDAENNPVQRQIDTSSAAGDFGSGWEESTSELANQAALEDPQAMVVPFEPALTPEEEKEQRIVLELKEAYLNLESAGALPNDELISGLETSFSAEATNSNLEAFALQEIGYIAGDWARFTEFAWIIDQSIDFFDRLTERYGTDGEFLEQDGQRIFPNGLEEYMSLGYNVSKSIATRCDLLVYMIDQFEPVPIPATFAGFGAYIHATFRRIALRIALAKITSGMNTFSGAVLSNAFGDTIQDQDPNVEEKKKFAVDVISQFNTKLDIAFQIYDHMIANGMNPPDELGRIKNVEDGAFEGTDGMDIVLGGSGDEVIYGKGGNDLIFGGGGNDQIYGGDGDDLIYGGGGNDEIHDGAGDDVVYGGSGGDTIYEGEGVDTIYEGNQPPSLSSGFNTFDWVSAVERHDLEFEMLNALWRVIATTLPKSDDPQAQIALVVSGMSTFLEGEGIVLTGEIENGAQVTEAGIDYDSVIDDTVDYLVSVMEADRREDGHPETLDNEALEDFAIELQKAENFLPSDELITQLEIIGNTIDQNPYDAIDLAQQAADIRLHKNYVEETVAIFGGDTTGYADDFVGPIPLILPEAPDVYEIAQDVLRHLDEIGAEFREAYMFLSSQEEPAGGTGYEIGEFLSASITVGTFVNVLKAIEFVSLERSEDIILSEETEAVQETRRLRGDGNEGGIRGRAREMMDNFLHNTFGTAFDAIAIVRRSDFTYSMLLELVPGGEEFLAQGQELLETAVTYFTEKLAEHELTLERISGLYDEALGNLSWWDIGTVALAGMTGGTGLFILAQRVFGDIMADATAFVADIASDAGRFILEGTLKLVDPSGEILEWLENAGDTITKIYEDPRQFISNLSTAFRDGFVQFGLNFGDHLRERFFGWLFGEINSGTGGIQLPERFDLPGIFSLTTQILDISWSGGGHPIRSKVVDAINGLGADGETVVSWGETSFELIEEIQQEGIGAIWDQLVGQLNNFWEEITGTITVWARDQVIMKGVEEVIAAFIPGVGVIKAIHDIYNMVDTLIKQLKELFALLDLVIQALNKIVEGDTQEASDYIEMALGNGITVSIEFLASALNLNIAQSIRGALEYIRGTVDTAIQAGIDWLAGNLVSESPDRPADFDNPNEEFYLYDSDEEMATFIEANGIEPVRLGTETHHVEIHADATGDDVVIVAGVASEWTPAERIRDTILAGANDTNSDIAGRQQEINDLYAPVDEKVKSLIGIKDILRESREEARTSGKSARNDWTSELRTMETVIEGEVTTAVKTFIAEAWTRFGNFLPLNLQPSGEIFKEKNFSGDASKLDKYHEGTEADPIPIMWYKGPEEYPTVTYQGKNYAYGSRLDIDGETFQVAASNQPNDKGKKEGEPGSYKIRKQSHFETRANQVRFNKVFNENGVTINGIQNPLGEAGGFDGDHVKDLGFGGVDAANNYWPLSATANRRAFNGYNAGYILNYVDKKGGTPEAKSRVIGGMIGKWFVVKEFARQNTPSESGTPAAGLFPADE